MNIPWEYEPQGFTLSDGLNYLPDFLLPECATLCEVKGSPDEVDWQLLRTAACEIPARTPQPGSKRGPALMVLGPIPRPRPIGDYGFPSFYPNGEGDVVLLDSGFGYYYRNRRPEQYGFGGDDSESLFGVYHPDATDYAQPAFEAARSARFEHGQHGAA